MHFFLRYLTVQSGLPEPWGYWWIRWLWSRWFINFLITGAKTASNITLWRKSFFQPGPVLWILFFFFLLFSKRILWPTFILKKIKQFGLALVITLMKSTLSIASAIWDMGYICKKKSPELILFCSLSWFIVHLIIFIKTFIMMDVFYFCRLYIVFSTHFLVLCNFLLCFDFFFLECKYLYIFQNIWLYR